MIGAAWRFGSLFAGFDPVPVIRIAKPRTFVVSLGVSLPFYDAWFRTNRLVDVRLINAASATNFKIENINEDSISCLRFGVSYCF